MRLQPSIPYQVPSTLATHTGLQHMWAPFSCAFISMIHLPLYFQCLSQSLCSIYTGYLYISWLFCLSFSCYCFLHLKRPVLSCTFFTTTSSYSFPQLPKLPHIVLLLPLFHHLSQAICKVVIYVYVYIIYPNTPISENSKQLDGIFNASLGKH